VGTSQAARGNCERVQPVKHRPLRARLVVLSGEDDNHAKSNALLAAAALLIAALASACSGGDVSPQHSRHPCWHDAFCNGRRTLGPR